MATPAPIGTLETTTEAAGHDIVVIGASAGGNSVLIELAKQLPLDFPAAVFTAYHMPAGAEGHLADALKTTGRLPAKHAEDGEEIRHGVVYVAPPDRHLLVKSGYLRVTHGPRENRWRPAIDPLFRSAAVAYGSRVIGVVLSGMLDDGTAGMLAIKRCGGTTIVQDPLDAAYPEMPQSALANVEIDHVLDASNIASTIARLARETAGEGPEIPQELAAEARIAEGGEITPEPERVVATGLMCPECGGPLREQSTEGFDQYRCLVGHAWSAQSLLAGSDVALEGTVWAAIRLFRQRANLLTLASKRERTAGRASMAKHYEQNAKEAQEHAIRLQGMVLRGLNVPARG